MSVTYRAPSRPTDKTFRMQVYPLARPAEQSPARPFDPSTRHALSFPIPQGEAESATVKSWVAEMKTYADTATTVQQVSSLSLLDGALLCRDSFAVRREQVMEHMVQTYPCALSDGQKKRLATRATGQLVLPRRTRYVTATVMLWKARRAIQGRYAARHEGVTHQELEDMMTQMAKDFEDSLVSDILGSSHGTANPTPLRSLDPNSSCRTPGLVVTCAVYERCGMEL